MLLLLTGEFPPQNTQMEESDEGSTQLQSWIDSCLIGDEPFGGGVAQLRMSLIVAQLEMNLLDGIYPIRMSLRESGGGCLCYVSRVGASLLITHKQRTPMTSAMEFYWQ